MDDLSAIEKDILGEAYVPDEPSKSLSTLCSFGSWFSGTPDERQAVEYILIKMKEYGPNGPHKEEVDYLG